jgi:hypothetical protein
VRWILSFVVAVGCGGAARLGYDWRSTATWVEPDRKPSRWEPEGTCPATLRVRVVDADGAFIVGAEVTVHHLVAVTAPSVMPIATEYRSRPVATDVHGFAVVCHPNDMPPTPPNQPHFPGHESAHIEARLGSRTATLESPFTGPLVLAR